MGRAYKKELENCTCRRIEKMQKASTHDDPPQ
jgi:hypothetical protein